MFQIKNYRHTFFACCAGYFVQSIINNFLPLLFITLQRDFDISYGEISLLIAINFGVQLFVDLAVDAQSCGNLVILVAELVSFVVLIAQRSIVCVLVSTARYAEVVVLAH